MSDSTVEDQPEVSNVRIAGAFLLDFFTIFFVAGYAVARLNGSAYLGGKTALIAVAVAIAYFVIGKYAGGTLWQRIIRIK